MSERVRGERPRRVRLDPVERVRHVRVWLDRGIREDRDVVCGEQERVFGGELVVGLERHASGHARRLEALHQSHAQRIVLAARVADAVDQESLAWREDRQGHVDAEAPAEAAASALVTSWSNAPDASSMRNCSGICPSACVAQLRHGS